MMRHIYPLLLAAVLLCSCSHIDESERYIYVKPADVARKVLIEDFTGQQCVNCPAATHEIELLKAEYGDGNIVAVGIHSGPLGFKGTATQVGLATDLGDTYYNYWQIEYQPQGVVNRQGGRSDYQTWASQVREAIQTVPSLDIHISSTYDAATRQATVSVTTTGTNGPTDGRLQLWLVEDSITALQVRYNDITDASSGQQRDRDYVHNHVLRAAVNGTWGTEFSLQEGKTQTATFSAAVDERWDAAHLSVVAFVYNDRGVAQAEQQPLNPK